MFRRPANPLAPSNGAPNCKSDLGLRFAAGNAARSDIGADLCDARKLLPPKEEVAR